MRFTRNDCYLIPIFAPAVALIIVCLLALAVAGCNDSDVPAPSAHAATAAAVIVTSDYYTSVQRVKVGQQDFLVFTNSRGGLCVVRVTWSEQ